MPNSKIENTIIIFGSGRSGTTLLNKVLSLHPSFSWISGYVNKYPWFPIISILNGIYKSRLIEKYTRSKRFFPGPSEAYGFWEYFFPGFTNNPQKILIEPENVRRCQITIRKILKITGKKYFIIKITGQARMDVLDKVFQNPKIIWIERDPRAVVYSFYKQKWFYRELKLLFDSDSQVELISRYIDKYYIFLAQHEILKSRFELVSVSYENMISDRISFFSKLLNNVNLPYSEQFMKLLKSYEFSTNENLQWQRKLSKESIKVLEAKLNRGRSFAN